MAKNEQLAPRPGSRDERGGRHQAWDSADFREIDLDDHLTEEIIDRGDKLDDQGEGDEDEVAGESQTPTPV